METQWYYMQDDEQCGPLSSKQLIALVQTGELTPAHMIWKEGLSGWIPAGSISGLFKEQPQEIWMVKLCDRITNLQPPPEHWHQNKIEAYKNEATLILENLGESSQYLANRLQDKMDDYKA